MDYISVILLVLSFHCAKQRFNFKGDAYIRHNNQACSISYRINYKSFGSEQRTTDTLTACR